MLKRGSVYIIPDENQLSANVFKKEIDMSHLPAIQEFCDKYKLGYQFKPGQYHEAPCILAIDGNLVVKTVDDVSLVIFYLPKHITNDQLMWLFSSKDKFSHYQMIEGTIVDGTHLNIETNNITGIDAIWKYMNQQYLLNSKNHDNSKLR